MGAQTEWRGAAAVAACSLAVPTTVWVAYKLYSKLFALNPVASTAVMVQGGRVREALQEKPILQDDLAVAISGPFRAASGLKLLAPRMEQMPVVGQGSSPAAKKLAGSRIVDSISCRCAWMEEQITAALQQMVSKQRSFSKKPAPAAANGNAAPQVVLLGAGMDTRAWRLPLPPGTSWFELDQADLTAAKVAALDALGAQQAAPGQPGRPGVAGQLWGLVRQARWLAALRWAGLVAWWKKDAVLQQVVDHLNDRVAPMLPLLGGHGPRLNAASRTTLVTDLNQPGWDQQLLAAGFNTARPTVWVAEGLVYYLQPEAAKELLKITSQLSAPGSAYIGSMADQAMGAWLTHQLESGAWPRSTAASHWKFYCPQDLKSFLAATGGWQLTVAKDCQEAALDKGWNMTLVMDVKDWVDDKGQRPHCCTQLKGSFGTPQICSKGGVSICKAAQR